MIHVYINYPNAYIAIHRNRHCSRILQGRKKKQRYLKMDRENFEKLFIQFRNREFRFAATPEFNDMWLIIDFDDPEKEVPLVKEIKRVLARHFKPFVNAPVTTHC